MSLEPSAEHCCVSRSAHSLGGKGTYGVKWWQRRRGWSANRAGGTKAEQKEEDKYLERKRERRQEARVRGSSPTFTCTLLISLRKATRKKYPEQRVLEGFEGRDGR